MRLRKLLTREMSTISKSTPYVRAFKVCSLLVLLPEVFLAFAVLFNSITLTEFWQISLGLLVLWPMMPLILRLKNDKAFYFVAGFALIVVVVFLVSMEMCDQYYIKSVFEVYLQGGDCRRKSESLSRFTSSNAIAYTQFLIDESEYLRRSVLEVEQLDKTTKASMLAECSNLRNRIIEHMGGLDERFVAAGYSNRSSVVGLETIRGKYNHLINSLKVDSTAGK